MGFVSGYSQEVFRIINQKRIIIKSSRPLIIQLVVKKIFSSIYFKVIATFFILFYLFHQIDLHLLSTALKAVNYPYIPLLIFVIFVFWIINVVGLYLLLLPIGKLPFNTFFKYQLKSIVLGSVTPMQIGEATIFVYLNQMNIPIQKTFSAFLLNKVIHLALMLLTGCVFLYYIDFPYLGLILFGGISVVIFFGVSINSQLRGIIRDSFVKKYVPQYYDFFELTADYTRKHGKYLLLNILFNVLKILIAGFEIWLTFFVFHIEDDFWLLISIYNLSRVLALFPVSIGGLGILEGGVALSLARLGFNYSVVILAMFFSRILAIVLALLTLSYYGLQQWH